VLKFATRFLLPCLGLLDSCSLLFRFSLSLQLKHCCLHRCLLPHLVLLISAPLIVHRKANGENLVRDLELHKNDFDILQAPTLSESSEAVRPDFPNGFYSSWKALGTGSTDQLEVIGDGLLV